MLDDLLIGTFRFMDARLFIRFREGKNSTPVVVALLIVVVVVVVVAVDEERSDSIWISFHSWRFTTRERKRATTIKPT